MTSEMSEAPASTARPATTAPEQRDNGSGNLSAAEQIDLVVPPVEYTTRFASPTDLNISLRSGYGADRPDVPRGERRQPLLGERVVHPAAGHDEGALRAAHQGSRRGHLVLVDAGPAHAPGPRLEEGLREVEGLGLHVLWQCEEGRAAVRRVEHR
jgi:hypothetical protein